MGWTTGGRGWGRGVMGRKNNRLREHRSAPRVEPQTRQARAPHGFCRFCAKANHASRESARRTAMKYRHAALNVYHCASSGMWHVGHPPRCVREQPGARLVNLSGKPAWAQGW